MFLWNSVFSLWSSVQQLVKNLHRGSLPEYSGPQRDTKSFLDSPRSLARDNYHLILNKLFEFRNSWFEISYNFCPELYSFGP